jgi:hypothetical protein
LKRPIVTPSLLGGLLILSHVAGAAPTGDGETDALINRLTRPPSQVPLPPLPLDPLLALVTAANLHSVTLGYSVDHGPAIRRSGIPKAFAGRVAQLLQAIIECRVATTIHTRRDCAAKVNDAAAGVINTKTPAFGDINAWPVLYIDGNASRDTYVHDYTVLIDTGGDDIYDNNAGGNLQDIKNGPPGSAAQNIGPAIGCEQVQGNFPAPTASAHDCIASPQVVFIDKSDGIATSNDIYGLFKSPRTTDHNPPATGARKVDGDCTLDKLVRRIVLQGSGFEGNGLLIDVGGNDKYRGKTAAQGSGHIGGVGILRDLGGGADRYHTIRNSQGFSLVGAFGLLDDDGGNDKYTTYMPAPKDPNVPFQADGSGGVVDDTGVCDNLPRMVQGAALLGGFGVLVDNNGQDLYMGAPADTQPFMPGILFFHSSQGFGCDGGVGSLTDNGGDVDRYREGPEGRVDGAQLTEPQTACFAAPGLGTFQDDGP